MPTLSAIIATAAYAALPPAERERALAVLHYLSTAGERAPFGRAAEHLAGLAVAMGCGEEAARKRLARYRRTGNWQDLLDRRHRPAARTADAGVHSERFRAWVARMAEAHQLSTAGAIATIHDAFRYGIPGGIPGFERWQPCGPGGTLPPGISAGTLRRLITKSELANIRQGLKTNASALPLVLTTREGIRPGTIYEFDDVWHDNLVILPGQKAPVRVLEFGALDVASGCRIHWGHCPRVFKDAGDTRQGLTRKMFVLFLATVLRQIGFAASGVTLITEHNTASIPPRIKNLLENSGLNITIRTSGIVGTVQKNLGGYTGAIGGNPRGKTHIEASHAAIHKILAYLPGQTGKDRQHTQEATLGRIKETRQLARYADTLTRLGRGDLARALQYPFLTLAQFSQTLTLNYTLWNQRTDHTLEGWVKRHTTEYLLPSGDWITPAQWQTRMGTPLPGTLTAAIAQNPANIRVRRQSPQEVWENERPAEWTRIPLALYIEMLRDEDDFGRTLTVRHAQLETRERLLSSDALIYTARVTLPAGGVLHLPENSRWQCVLNPFDINNLVILSPDNGQIIGTAPLYTRVSIADETAIHHLTGKIAEEKAHRLAEQRARWAGQTALAERTRAENRALLEQARLPLGGTPHAHTLPPLDQTAAENSPPPLPDGANPTPLDLPEDYENPATFL